MKRFGILLCVVATGFVNTALAWSIINNTDSQIFYEREKQIINPSQSFQPSRQDDIQVVITWAKQDSTGIHWNPKSPVSCPVNNNQNVTITGSCGTITVNTQDNSVTCSTGARTPTCANK